MRWFEGYLKVDGWSSGCRSVQRLLDHLARKTKSESSRRHYLETVASLCRREGREPDLIVGLAKGEVEDAIQAYLDSMKKKDRSTTYINVSLAQLETFFRANGFRKERELDLERYHQPTRYRKRPEYIPTDQEIWDMVIAGNDPKEKAELLFTYTSGCRNSTARAVRYGDIRRELDSALDVVHVPVRVSMKEVDADPAKGGLEYESFISAEAVNAVKEYLRWFEERHGRQIPPEWPLFPGKTLGGGPIKRRTLEVMVKRAARKAGIERWRDVHPHCLRKAFERALRNSGLDTKDQEFLMGHTLEGAQDTYYDKTKIEELREKFRRVRFFSRNAVTKDEMMDTMRKELLLMVGYGEEQVAQLGGLSKLPQEQMDRMIDQKWQEKLGLKRNHRQKVVPREEVKKQIEDGWEFVNWLDEGRAEAILRLQSS